MSESGRERKTLRVTEAEEASASMSGIEGQLLGRSFMSSCRSLRKMDAAKLVAIRITNVSQLDRAHRCRLARTWRGFD